MHNRILSFTCESVKLSGPFAPFITDRGSSALSLQLVTGLTLSVQIHDLTVCLQKSATQRQKWWSIPPPKNYGCPDASAYALQLNLIISR